MKDMAEPGRLLLCATPIGNLEDMTPRVIAAMREADVIAAEDTRNTIKLLNHFDIHTPMVSYHEYNKFERADELVGRMLRGETVAVVTDAGTPAISDPGEVLAAKCIEAGIRVSSLPGACALITALTMSGMSARRFAFEGFLPNDKSEKKERTRILNQLADEERTMILYEAPHRLRTTLRDLEEHLGDRKVTLCRELTKRYEEAVPTTLRGALELYEEKEPRGEYVLVLEGKSREEREEESRREWEQMSVKDHVALYEGKGMTRKEAMKAAAQDRGISRREIYDQLLEED